MFYIPLYKCPKCKDGFYWDEEAGDFGNCTLECSDIHEACSSCDLRGEVCLTCTDGYMPEHDGSTCIEHFKNCKVEIEDQTEGDLPVDSVGFYCKDCISGYFWWAPERMCLKCNIYNCAECQDDGAGAITCTKCLNGFMPSFDGLSC